MTQTRFETSWLWRGLCLVLLLAIFLADSLTPLGFDHGSLYLIIVLCAMLSTTPRFLIFLTAMAIAATIGGLFISTPGVSIELAMINRGITCIELSLLCALSIFVRQRVERSTQTSLALEESRSIIDQQHELLDIATSTARMGGWSMTSRTLEITWSDYVCKLHGVARGHVPELTEALQAYAPLWQAQMQQHVEDCLAQGRSFEQEAELLAVDGTSSWVRVNGQAIRDAAGKVIRLQGYIQNITAERESQILLVQMRHRFHQLANAVPQIIWTAEPEGDLDYVNKAFNDYCGVNNSGDLLGNGWLSFVHINDLSAVSTAWAAMLAQPGYHVMEFGLRRADGCFRRHVVQAHPVRDESGLLIKWCGSAVDIHESWILAESHTSMLENITDAFLAIDNNWRFTYVNREAETLLQRKREDLLGTCVWDQFPDAGNFEEHYLRALATRTTVDFQEYYSGVGKWFDVRAFPADEGLIVYFRDVTASRLHAEEIRLAHERFEILARSTTDAIWDWNLLTDSIWWNDSMFTLFGYSNEDLEPDSRSWSRHVHPDDLETVMASVDRALASGAADWQCEYRFCCKDGTTANVLNRGSIIRDIAGKPVRMIGGIVDITETRQLQERLGQAQRLEALGQLTGGVAHDFNNLLTVIMGNAELLSEQLAGDKRLFGMVDLINQASDRASKLTRHLLAFARRQPLEPETVDIGKLINGMEALLRSTLMENYDIVFSHDPDLWCALVDAAQLESAVLNLCLNARDAMANGGKLSLQSSNVTLDQQYAAQHTDMLPGDYVLVSVTDNGSGMTAETLRHAFDPFYTTKSTGKGTGLGLSMVYGFVRQSRGHIHIYSEVDHGTTVRMYLPRASDNLQHNEVTPAAISHHGSQTILLVEDDPLVSVYATKLLRDMGYHVLNAGSGPEALAVLDRVEDVSLLFTDIVMPGGMNGRQLADAACKLRPDLKVLFTSGYTEDTIIHNGQLDSGINLLSKPYQRKDLVNKLKKVMTDT